MKDFGAYPLSGAQLKDTEQYLPGWKILEGAWLKHTRGLPTQCKGTGWGSVERYLEIPTQWKDTGVQSLFERYQGNRGLC